MTNDSTTLMSSTSMNLQSKKSPSKMSIELIRQFARSCNVINDMSFRIMMAN